MICTQKGKLAVFCSPRTAIVKLKMRTVRISSTTAAPRIVAPFRPSRACSSFKTSTEIETEVAAKVMPKNRLLVMLKPQLRPKTNTTATGTMTPIMATNMPGLKYFFNKSRSLSKPARNIKIMTPISANNEIM